MKLGERRMAGPGPFGWNERQSIHIARHSTLADYITPWHLHCRMTFMLMMSVFIGSVDGKALYALCKDESKEETSRRQFDGISEVVKPTINANKIN